MAKSIQDILQKMENERMQRIANERAQIEKIAKRNEIARQEWLKNNRIYESSSSNSPSSSSSAGGGKIPVIPPSINIEITDFQTAHFSPVINSVTVDITGSGENITERGIVYTGDPDPSLGLSPSYTATDDGTGYGTFTLTNITVEAFYEQDTYLRAYAITDEEGVVYSATVSWIPELCLAKGTKITLSDLTHKNIEDVEYGDELLVWNFDIGNFSKSNPLWIKKSNKTNKFNLLTFSDVTTLKTISQHRIFNKESGMFTYPMTDDTPIGTTTFNEFGEEVKLVGKEIINDEIEYYNIITNRHINMFANGVLTSCKFNNIYPINNMKFVKDNRQLRSREEFINISDDYFNGLRLSEQKMDVKDIETYINRLKKYELSLQLA